MRDAAIETNEQGGQGSVTEGGFHLGFPARGALIVASVVKEGAKRYAVNNWRLVTPEEHYNHAVEHLMRLADPMDPSNDPRSTDHEDHAAHAACRLLMFLETRKIDRKLAFHVVPTPSKPEPIEREHPFLAALRQQATPIDQGINCRTASLFPPTAYSGSQ